MRYNLRTWYTLLGVYGGLDKMRKNSQKTREKNRKSLFIALKYTATFFYSVCRTNANLLFKVGTLSSLMVLIFAQAVLVQSARKDLFETIGTTEKINIYPGEILDTQWGGYEYVLSQDVGSDALYQDFTERNAAYVTDEIILLNDNSRPVRDTSSRNTRKDTVISAQNTPSTSTVATGTSAAIISERTTDFPEEDQQLDTDVPSETPIQIDATDVNIVPDSSQEEPVPLEESAVEESGTEEPEVDPETATEPVVFKKATASFFAFFSTVTQMFPFTNAGTSTDVITPEAGASITNGETQQPVASEVDASIADEETQQSNAPEEGASIADEETQQSAVLEDEPELLASTTGNIEEVTELPTLEEVTTLPSATTTPEIEIENVASSAGNLEEDSAEIVLIEKIGTHTISLADFGTSPLRPGEFIKNIQLRVSLAGKYEVQASSAIPYVEFVVHTPSSTQTLGTVLLDGEASNAINGGYYLFGFPQYDNTKVLKDVVIDVVYHGDTEHLSGLYLDALWLELETETITRDDLYARSKGNELSHMKSPRVHEFVSEKRDFTRFENPVFNLRYVSQRNRTVEALREFLGQKKMKVQKIDVKHNASGLVGVTPEVTVTKDGLVSIAIPEEERLKMKPGLYTVEIELSEGGKMVTDSFDFQWGLLAINSNKTDYQFNETAEISLGALTPNGNTLCSANLRLYVINPLGSVSVVPVNQSGQCNGNNVIDVPDYTSQILLDDVGEYELYLERLGDDGQVISHTGMRFNVDLSRSLSLERKGPTRIFPPALYPMELTVYSENGFSGTLTERIPSSFAVSSAGAEVTVGSKINELSWEVNLLSGQSKTFSYTFDAPDISPYLYELGPARLEGDMVNMDKVKGVATSTASSTIDNRDETISAEEPTVQLLDTPQLSQAQQDQYTFEEHRQWQIASDAVGNMILFWDDAAGIPDGWDCISCNAASSSFESFFVGSSTYGNIGGTASHTPTISAEVFQNTTAATESGTGGIAASGHDHTYTPTVAEAANIPPYRQLRVIRYRLNAGEVPTMGIPFGAIGIFDAAVSGDWIQYSAQDGYYVRGGDTVGSIGGDSTHTHAITGTTGGSTNGTARTRGGGSQAAAASDGHTHDVSTTTPDLNHEPPYIDVILGKANATTSPTNGLIAMWDADVPSGWLDSSSDGASAFNNKFLRASTSYDVVGGGAESHAHGKVEGVITTVPSATTNGRAGSSGSIGTHQHTVDLATSSVSSNLPPFVSVVFGKRQGTDPVYEQTAYRWYANENAQTPSDPWPSGVDDLVENEAITATSTVVKNDDEIRLRIGVELSNATSTAGQFFKLQFAASPNCSAVGTWLDVGDTASSTIWRGYANAGVTDGSTLSTLVLASSTVEETYQENGIATSSPNEIPVGGVGEWDFVLEHNAAAAGTNYCFRMVENDGTAFATYTNYPQLVTNQAPLEPTLFTLFDNEKASSTEPLFTFVTTDPESEDLHYQVQISDDYTFGSTSEDKNTISNSSQFENQVVPADKAPFTSGQLIQFNPANTMTNGTTYWWRVRSKDPDGSDEWGEWADPDSFTIDTTLLASAWYQTTQEQFDTNTLNGVVTAVGAANLIGASTTGTMISPAIDFDAGTAGTAWGSLVFTDSGSTIDYTLQYFTDGAIWADVPDGDLPGNSSGLTSSPVSLLNLDTATYNDIRIRANYTTGGSPSVLDWGILWGYRVDTPTITKLFPNEKTATTTPLFEFTTTDPQSDDLTYQISWSTDETFTSSTTRTSEPATVGFSNIDAGGDADPFNSGDTIQYQIQGADALTNDTTYWWRVRAKDSGVGGDDAYSFWTQEQSFTVDTTVVVSTWFQTTQEQFDTDILSGTIADTSDSVQVATTAVEALLVYGEGTDSIPKYRQWDGSVWGSEAEMLTIDSPLSWARTKAATTREEYIAATVGSDGDVNVQIFGTGEWSNLQKMTTNMGDTNSRGFDVTYETVSGDAMVVYCDSTVTPKYRIWNGSTWGSETSVGLTLANNCEWVELASNPESNEIVVLVADALGSSYSARVWSGTAWGNTTSHGSIVDEDHQGMTVAYESNGGGTAVIVTSDGNPARFEWNSWTTAGGWGTAGTQGIGDDFEWGTLVADDGSDDLALCYVDEDADIGTLRWSGGAWSGQIEHTLDGRTKISPGFSCVFETGTNDGDILVAYTDSTQTNYRTGDATPTWSTEATVDNIGPTVTSQLVRTGDGTILGLFFDDANDTLISSNWNGSAWSASTTIENNASVDTSPYGRPYSMAVRNAGKDGTTIVSPGINFTDGIGPYWQEMSWNDTTPVSSEILYSLQYNNGTSWALIPDADLPGNEAGTTTSPIDLSGLSKTTYNLIRPYAALSCDGSNNCPTLLDWTVTWAEGLTISGTAQGYDQSTNVTSGTVAVAVNGVLQSGKTGTITAGVWSIPNVTVSAGDVVTVFVTAADAAEAVGVTIYDGTGNITGFQLYERHIALGSDDATSTALTNADIGLYDFTNTEDVFFDVIGDDLTACSDVGCSDVEIFVNASSTYNPGGTVDTHDIEINGTLISTSTLYISGSWDNNATTTLTNATVVMVATSTTETIDTTGAAVPTFGNLEFGTTTGAATWTLTNTLDVDGDLTVTRGTLARGTTSITLAGDLTNGTNGLWSGIGTTTFDGTVGATWSDVNATLQNVGDVVIDGTGKIVTLAGNVAANNIIIEADDTLDASVGSYDLTTYGDFINNNTFVSRNGAVLFAATTTGQLITSGGDAFYDMQFTGGGGAWSFTESTLTVDNDYTIATGTVTMTTATTTIGGSFSSAGGIFVHNNSAIEFDGTGTETITASGTVFANAFYDLSFSGSGSWTMLDESATTSNDLLITAGTVVMPATELAIGGSLLNTGGTITASAGTVSMYSGGAESITLNGSSLFNLLVDGAGTFTVTDTNATASGDLTVDSGTLVLPTGTFSLGGSLTNGSTINPQTGTVLFNSSDTGETVDVGTSSLYTMNFSSATGGWTVTTNATSTADTTLTSGLFTLSPGATLSVGATFSSLTGGASTTWTGATLSLEAGVYEINTKDNGGDSYDTLRIGSTADISMWNSQATTVTVVSGGSLYSQDHAAVDGDLYVYGEYERTSGSEYWSYATDFDGVALGTSSRQANVRLSSGATASMTGVLFEMLGDSAASSTVANQGSGTYTVLVSGGTTTATYYDMADLGATGLSLLASTTVTSLNDGGFTVAAPGGTAVTVSSTTIASNQAEQIFRVSFATTTAIAATNVSQVDGTPSSYWWFRESSGNLDGEVNDNDSGDPGSVRWDDSSLVITIAGTVFTDAGVTALTGGTCDGVTNSVRVVVENGATYDGTCSAVDGTYSIGGVVVIGDPTVTVFLNDAPGGEYATMVTKTPTADITNADLYVNRVIVRHEDVSAMTIDDMAAYDSSDDADVRFTAATTTTVTLDTFAQTELYVWATMTFTPGGTVTLLADSSANTYDGSLYIANGATFTGAGTTTYTVGGIFTQGAGATFVPASSTVLMNATTSGKAITASVGETIAFNQLTFNGSGGAWNINADITATADVYVQTGTVTGTGDVTLTAGSFYGNGLVSMGGGTTTVETTNTLGGTQEWTFYDLTVGNGTVSGTTTPGSTATTTVLNVFTIETGHFYDAGASGLELSGSGGVFIENGTYLEDTGTVRYSGTAATDLLATNYYNLDLNASVGTPTYTATGIGISIANDLFVGGEAATIVDFDTNDTVLNVDGDIVIQSNGTFISSDSAAFTVAGSYDNNGSYSASGGLITFDGTGTQTVAAGNSDFATVLMNGAGSYILTEHATATDAFTLSNTASFTLASGQTLAVGGDFANNVGGAATTWDSTTLSLYGGGNYLVNSSSVTEVYNNVLIGANTDVRMWNSVATTTTLSGGSLYSMDHDNTSGDLYIFGAYENGTDTDFWSYATDFDGTDISGGGERKVDVYVEGSESVLFSSGGSLMMTGTGAFPTTIQNQGSGVYAFTIGDAASTTMTYYAFENVDSDGLTFTGSPNIVDLSQGSFLVGNNSDSAMTVDGTAIDVNPVRIFSGNVFATSSGVTSAVNVTTSGISVSSWRFTGHSGDIAGEDFDNDGGNPGYITWDDSALEITISGSVYSDEGSSVSTACDSTASNIRLVGTGFTATTTSCAGDGLGAGTGIYTFDGIAVATSTTLTVYINDHASNAITVTKDSVSSISNLDLYENRLIVRHESTDPLTISDMTSFDSSDDPDGDVLFTAVAGSPDTLTLPSDTKLLVWTNKEFEPGGNVTLSGGGAGAAYDGTVQLYADAIWTSNGTEEHSIGGSLILDTDATFQAANSTTTFTTTGTARTIDVNAESFYNVAFTGSGSWALTDTTFDAQDVFITAGVVTLPTGTTTISGTFTNNGGAFTNNGSLMVFDGAGSGNVVQGGSSDFAEMQFTGSGAWNMTDVNATSTGSVTIGAGSLTLPSGVFVVGGDFSNTGGTVTHNTSEIKFTSNSAASLYANGSDLGGVEFAGTGPYVITDGSLTLTENLTISAGSVTLASGTMSIGGSLNASGGTFDNATGTILFNSSDVGETIDAGGNDFYNVLFGSGTGGWTITTDATTTNNFTLNTASDFTLASGQVLTVGNVFRNNVGGSPTTWDSSTLRLISGTTYEMNSTSTSDSYQTLYVGANTDVSMWNSQATTTTVDDSGSLYSQDHATIDGSLYIYGDYHIDVATEHWSYATDFNLDDLSGGNERAVTVSFASNATTTVDGGILNIVGESGNETTITNQGSGTYAFAVTDGTFNALYYAYRNLDGNGLNLSGEPTISSLTEGDFELAVDSGTLINLSSTTLNANASLIITGTRFATTTAITGNNVTLNGTNANAWTFISHTGNLAGEGFDVDGGDACGSIRWDDSACLLTQQVHYRWRNDDGGIGVPADEWYDTDWNKRKRVRIENDDASTYTDAAIKLVVTYDADMQVGFDDLRFTDDSGTTSLNYWIERYTASTEADVWVQVPTLPANDTATIFMYYNNVVATTTSSSTETFIVADDFEDENISEYADAGDDKSEFAVNGNFAYGGSFGLDVTNSMSQTEDGGIARFDQTVSQGEIIRYMQYVDTGDGAADEVCTLFGVQSPVSNNNNYAVCIEQVTGTDRISISENVTDIDTSGTILASTTVAYSTGWYEVEIDWKTDDSINVTLSTGGSVVATTSATDVSYTSGGFGFTYWFNSGGWDNFTSRPRVDTEPTIRFGAEQSDGGATWAADIDTPYGGFIVNDVARLRILLENSGLQVTNQTYVLEYAEQGAAPSCEAVTAVNYVDVPVQGSCGASPLCMQSSSNVTDGESTTDLLSIANGDFVAGELTEDPSNTADSLTIDQNEYTELEYVLTPTASVVDEDICLRVSNSGTDLDTYLRVAKMTVKFDPSFGDVSFNLGADIALVAGTTTTVYATSSVTDQNGYADLQIGSSTMYSTIAGAACTADNNNCYIESTNSSCSFIDCSGNSCTLSCAADFYFHADATDTDGANQWWAFLEVEDTAGGYDFATSPSIEVMTLRALDVTNAINYGALAASSTSGVTNASTTVENLGNVAIDIDVTGTDLTDGYSSNIPASEQIFATTTFDYDACVTCTSLATTAISYEVDLAKPIVVSPATEDAVFWGIEIPFGVSSNPHTGGVLFTPISDS